MYQKVEFLLDMVFWYIFLAVNMVRKKLQSKAMCITATIKRNQNICFHILKTIEGQVLQQSTCDQKIYFGEQ